MAVPEQQSSVRPLRWYHEVLIHLPTVLLLTALVVVLHSCHLLDWTEAHALRYAVQRAFTSGAQSQFQLTGVGDESHQVQVLDISTRMRVDEMAYRDGAVVALDIDAAGGVRPIDRSQLAVLIDKLAVRLADLPSKPVVAVDIDVAPPVGHTPVDEQQNLAVAITALRKVATVVVTAYDRADAGERQRRNEFLAEKLKCTGAPGVSPAGGLQPLYIASPRVFHEVGGYPLHVHVAMPAAPANRSALAPADSDFPSLALLVELARVGQGVARTLDEKRISTTLTLLCDQAAAGVAAAAAAAGATRDDVEAGGMIVEDWIAGHLTPMPTRIAEDPRPYAFAPAKPRRTAINWRLIDNPKLLTRTELTSLHALEKEGKPNGKHLPLADDHLKAGILILGVDSGARQDRYMGATVMSDAVGGATLHGLMALSLRPGLKLDDHSLWAVLLDLLAGVLFLIFWHGANAAGARFGDLGGWRSSRVLATYASSSVLMLIVLGMGYASMTWVSPALLSASQWPLLGLNDLWVNPAYLIAGMYAHAYLERADAKAEGHVPDLPDFSFGLSTLWAQRSLKRSPIESAKWLDSGLPLWKPVVIAWALWAAMHQELGAFVQAGVVLALGLGLAQTLTHRIFERARKPHATD